MGFSNPSCRISWRFFSPPEKPSLTLRSPNAWSMSRSSIAALTSLTQCRSLGASPRTAVAAERRKFDIDTPGTSTGYCMARNKPGAGALVDAHRPARSAPSSVIEPDVTRVLRVSGDGVGQGRLARPVGPHHRMRFAGAHRQVDPVEDGDVVAVGGVLDADVQVLDFQSCHEAVILDSVMASSCSMAVVKRSRISGTAILAMISLKNPRTTSRRACSSGMPRARR